MNQIANKTINIRLFGGPCDGKYLKNQEEKEVLFVKKEIAISIEAILSSYEIYAYIRTNLYDQTNNLRLYIHESIDE